MKNVSIYTTVNCKFCKMTKEFFKANNIAYTEFNVGTDAGKRAEMIEKSGQMGVPVILVDNDVVIGYDEPRLRKLILGTPVTTPI